MTSEISIILLAAGSSSRMGQSKQLLKVEGEPLLLRSSKVAVGSGAGRLVVVLGADKEVHQEIIKDLPLTVVYNPHWKKGMGNSLKVGLKQVLKMAPGTEAVLVMVCDQPRLTPQYLIDLIQQYNTTKSKIVASAYSGTVGVPALFDKSFFQELLLVEDEQGAKKILDRHSDSIRTVDFSGGEIDLDTLEDFQTFIQKTKP